jgi:phage shock protein PspC (stress-responsive transcriptional regulator)
MVDMNTTQTFSTTDSHNGSSTDTATGAYRSRSLGSFRRSRENRVLGGVCGGLAHALGVDVAIVRVIAIVLAVITNGVGALAYLAAWLVVPEEGSDTSVLTGFLRR